MKIEDWEFSEELWDKISMMSEEEVLDFSEKNIIITDEVTGKLISVPREDYDAESVDYVVCGRVTPDGYRKEGSIDVPCHDCLAMVVLSPDSPVKPPKICNICAEGRKKGQQSINE